MKAKTLSIIGAVVMGVAALLWMAVATQRPSNTLTYSQFLEKVQTGQIARVTVMGSNSGAVQAICRLKDGNTVRTVLPRDYRDALIAMRETLVDIEIRDASSGSLRLLLNATPFLLLVGVWVFLMIRKFPQLASIRT